MAGKLKVRIQLDRKTPQFWPGEIVQGHLFVQTLRSPETISHLSLVLHGEAVVEIHRQNYILKRRYHYTQREVYVNSHRSLQQMTVVPHPDTLTSGIHVFRFQLLLPAGIPPTLRGTYGSIGYSLSVRHSNRRCLCSLSIAVLASLNVLCLPQAQEVVMREVESITGGCLMKHQEDIQVRAWLDRAGCFRGEQIPLHLEIVNNAHVAVKYTTLTLKKTVSYFSHEQQETSRRDAPGLKPVKLCRVPPLSSVTWGPDDVRIVLPASLVITGPPGCSVIQMSYELEIKVVLSPCTSAVLLLPVTVGAVPPPSVQAEIQNNLDVNRAQAAAALVAALGAAVEELQGRSHPAADPTTKEAHEA